MLHLQIISEAATHTGEQQKRKGKANSGGKTEKTTPPNGVGKQTLRQNSGLIKMKRKNERLGGEQKAAGASAGHTWS